jgi:hypothetical protein
MTHVYDPRRPGHDHPRRPAKLSVQSPPEPRPCYLAPMLARRSFHSSAEAKAPMLARRSLSVIHCLLWACRWQGQCHLVQWLRVHAPTHSRWICKDPTGLKLDPVLVLVAAAPSAHTAAGSQQSRSTGGRAAAVRPAAWLALLSLIYYERLAAAAGGWRLGPPRATRNKRQPLLTPRAHARPQAASGFFSVAALGALARNL